MPDSLGFNSDDAPELAGGLFHFSLSDVTDAQAVERFDAVGVEAGGGLVMGDGFIQTATAGQGVGQVEMAEFKFVLTLTAA